MDIDAKAARERIDKLRQEISALIAADKENRIRGSFVGWNDRKQHDIRLTRIQENQRGASETHTKKEMKLIDALHPIVPQGPKYASASSCLMGAE